MGGNGHNERLEDLHVIRQPGAVWGHTCHSAHVRYVKFREREKGAEMRGKRMESAQT